MSGASTYARNLKEKDAATEAVNKYAYLVKRIACHLKNRLPATVQEEDLVQSGMVGLLEAIKGFDATRGVGFEAYSSIRIRGAMSCGVATGRLDLCIKDTVKLRRPFSK